MEIKKKLRREGTKTGIFILCHQLIFQIGTLFMMVALGIAAYKFSVPEKKLEGISIYMGSDMMQFLAGIMFVILYIVNIEKIREIPIEKRKISCLDIVYGFGVVFAANMLISVVEIVFRRIFGIHLISSEISMAVSKDKLFIMIALMAIIPAILEEFIYRGVLYRVLRIHGSWLAAIVSSLIFGLVHMNFVQIPFAFVLGLTACYLYEKTGNLKAGMIVHFLNNSLTILAQALPASEFTLDMIQVIFGVAALIVLVIVSMKNKDILRQYLCKLKDVLKNEVVYFITSIPMLILIVACLAASILMVG